MKMLNAMPNNKKGFINLKFFFFWRNFSNKKRRSILEKTVKEYKRSIYVFRLRFRAFHIKHAADVASAELVYWAIEYTLQSLFGIKCFNMCAGSGEEVGDTNQ